ncbi:MAG: glycosyltransferase family 2 protein [Sphingomonadaceae bacterium]
MSKPPPVVSVAIVSFNTRELLRRCLASVVENPHHRIVTGAAWALTPSPPRPSSVTGGGPPHHRSPLPIEIVVVDNGSADGSADMVEQQFPQVRLVRAGENLGFARATNAGLKRCHGGLLLLLNPDTEVIGDSLVRMADFLAAHKLVAAVGPSLLYPDGRPQHGAFSFPNLWMSFFDFFPLNHRLTESRINGRYRTPANGSPFSIDHPLGAAMMVRREALVDVGLLDEGFFMYCEEIDWCLRAKRRGWKIYQVPSARVIHHGGQSTGQFREEMFVELHRSRYRLFAKHYTPSFVTGHRIITRIGLAREMARAHWRAFRGVIGRDELARRLQAYRAIWSM